MGRVYAKPVGRGYPFTESELAVLEWFLKHPEVFTVKDWDSFASLVLVKGVKTPVSPPHHKRLAKYYEKYKERINAEGLYLRPSKSHEQEQ